MKAWYRKYNDHSHSSSTYHKKDGTAVRAILGRLFKREMRAEELVHSEMAKKPESQKDQ